MISDKEEEGKNYFRKTFFEYGLKRLLANRMSYLMK